MSSKTCGPGRWEGELEWVRDIYEESGDFWEESYNPQLGTLQHIVLEDTELTTYRGAVTASEVISPYAISVHFDSNGFAYPQLYFTDEEYLQAIEEWENHPVDILCSCGFGRLACPVDELPEQCAICGSTFGYAEEI